jgi:hypothetical protein
LNLRPLPPESSALVSLRGSYFAHSQIFGLSSSQRSRFVEQRVAPRGIAFRLDVVQRAEQGPGQRQTRGGVIGMDAGQRAQFVE